MTRKRGIHQLKNLSAAEKLAARTWVIGFVRQETETRLLADAADLIKLGRALSDDLEVSRIFKVVSGAWRRYDRRLDAHQAALNEHGAGSRQTGRTLRDLLEARWSLLSNLNELAQVCYPDVEPIAPSVATMRKTLAGEIGPPPAELIVRPPRWSELSVTD